MFPWVFLVVRSLRNGLKEADDISDLLKRLRLLPGHLETYFQHILNSIEECYQEQSAQIFLIALNATQPLLVLTLSMLEMGPADFAVKAEIKPLNHSQINALEQRTCPRVNTRCKDLLEIYKCSFHPILRVEFMHRTAKDFLQTKHITDILKSRITNEFEPKVFLCESFLTQMKGINSDDGHQAAVLLDDFTHYALEIENHDKFSVFDLLDELDRVMTFHGAKSCHGWIYELHDHGRLIRWGPTAPGPDDFQLDVGYLEYILHAHLVRYIAYKLDSQSSLVLRQCMASNLLYLACCEMRYSNFLMESSFNKFCLLFERGATSNQRRHNEFHTAWGLVLHAAMRISRDRATLLLYRLIEKFILYGADPNAIVRRLATNEEMTVSESLHYITTETQAKQLERLLAEKEAEKAEGLMAGRRPTGFLRWIGWK